MNVSLREQQEPSEGLLLEATTQGNDFTKTLGRKKGKKRTRKNKQFRLERPVKKGAMKCGGQV